jgi:acyl-CoA reductase-like NAD-dependent aldehyde dehydrogenase
MENRDRIYVGGAWVSSTGTETIDVVNPTTEEVVGRIAEGTPEDVDRAVAAAKEAFPGWAETSADDRAKYLQRIAEGLQSRMEPLAKLITEEMGMPVRLSQIIQVGLPMTTFMSMSQVLQEVKFEEQIGNSRVVREPIGVVGCITPWNYPLHQIAAKVAPALAAGCTVVLKPSDVAPLNAFVLADIIEEIGLPAGVFNLVSGTGLTVGEAIVSHPDVDMVSFTGSTRAGRRVSELAAQRVKKIAVELGGKSPNVILEDADLPRAVASGVQDAYLNSGQTCSALTRMIVPRSKLAEVEELARQNAATYTPGDPFADGTRLGPLANATQLERVRGYIKKGRDEGAKLVTGGDDLPDGIDKGYFVKPTIFSEVKPDMTIAQEEIFGPVLSIIPYEDEDDAVRIANDTIYGLSGGVWSGDPEHALKVAKRIRTGQISINGGQFNPLAPFGGYKQSGHGRELGRFGLEEFLTVKSLQL